jgi:hypothetical protein
MTAGRGPAGPNLEYRFCPEKFLTLVAQAFQPVSRKLGWSCTAWKGCATGNTSFSCFTDGPKPVGNCFWLSLFCNAGQLEKDLVQKGVLRGGPSFFSSGPRSMVKKMAGEVAGIAL